MTRDVITFAIPFYGQRSLLEIAVRSVLEQSLDHWRLVVCDNASPEQGVSQWLDGLSDARIRYERAEQNIGIGGCFNWCLDVAENELVTLLHHDDFLLPDYAAVMWEAAERHPGAVGIFCPPRIVGADGETVFSLPDLVKRWMTPTARSEKASQEFHGESALAALLRANFICGPTVCFRRSILGKRRFSPEWKQVLDTELHCRLIVEGETLVGIGSPQYAYRRHASQTTRKNLDSLTYFSEEARLYDSLRPELKAKGWRTAERVAVQKRMLKLHLAYQILCDLGRFRGARLLEKLKFLRR